MLNLWRLRGYSCWFEGLSNVFTKRCVANTSGKLVTKFDLFLNLCREIHVIVRRLAFTFALFKLQLCCVPREHIGVGRQGCDQHGSLPIIHPTRINGGPL
jgi:hypothetical protein